MLTSILVTLAWLSTTAMGVTFQNKGSQDYLVTTPGPSIVLSSDAPTDFWPTCSGGTSPGTCTFSTGPHHYFLNDDDEGAVVLTPGTDGTPWNAFEGPAGIYQVKNLAGRCWTQRGGEIFLSPCINGDPRQQWIIYGL